jgi:hypothetical protein
MLLEPTAPWYILVPFITLPVGIYGVQEQHLNSEENDEVGHGEIFWENTERPLM